MLHPFVLFLCFLLSKMLTYCKVITNLSHFQDMIDMRDCYDRLLSAAAATTNSVYGIP